jgi:glutaredoxin-related protein
MQRIQFLSYLIVDQEREALQQTARQSIPPLDEEAKKLLAGIQKQITRLNNQCILSLTDVLPECGFAVDPYNNIRYGRITDTTEVPLLSDEDIENMARSFAHHPAILKAIETSTLANLELVSFQYALQVETLTKKILQSGPLNSPEDIDEIGKMGLRQANCAEIRRRSVYHHLGALAGIRYSLRVLNQLIFNAVLYDDFYTFDDNTIVDILLNSSHMSGLGMLATVCASNSVREWNLGLGDLVWVDFEKSPPLAYLGIIESISFEPSPSFGEGIRLALRAVDDSLNPLGYLIHL